MNVRELIDMLEPNEGQEDFEVRVEADELIVNDIAHLHITGVRWDYENNVAIIETGETPDEEE